MRISNMQSRQNVTKFSFEPSETETLHAWLDAELSAFGMKKTLHPPSPRKHQSAIQLIGALNYWVNGMVWAATFSNCLVVLLIQDKTINRMSEFEYEDYQANTDIRNDIIHHFMQIAARQ